MRKIVLLTCAVLMLASLSFARDLKDMAQSIDENINPIPGLIDRNTQAQTAVLTGSNTVNFTPPAGCSRVIFSVAPVEASYWVRLDGENATVPSATHNSTTFTSSIPSMVATKVNGNATSISITSDESCKVAVEYYE